jgi:predicted Zn-dependent peptidase
MPDGVVVAAAGSIEHEALVEMARSAETAHAGRAHAGGSPVPTVGQGEPGTPEFERRVCFLEKDTEQYHLCLGGAGLARHDERRFALRVLEGVLGGTSSSRLFQEVRERRGLAYAVFSFSNLYAQTGEVGLYVGTRPENLGEALAVVAAELERFVEDPADEEELVRSRENLKGQVVLSLESTSARASRLGASLLHGLPILSVDEVIERIDSVGFAEIRELAADLFLARELSVAGVGPREDAFQAAIEPLAGVASGDGHAAGGSPRQPGGGGARR